MWFALATIFGTGCDLSTKAWAELSLRGASRTLWDPWVSLQLAYNRGTAFSLVPKLGGSNMWFFGVLAVAIALIVAAYVWRTRPPAFESIALGSIVAGALGNGFDRLLRDAPGGGTGVVDFVSVTLPWGSRWPTFNVADALLVVGVTALLLRGAMLAKRGGSPPTAEAPG